MQKIKKTIVIILSIILVAGCFSVTTFAVKKTATIYSENFTANVGDTIHVPVYIGNNPGFSGFRIKIAYDENAFTPINVIKGAVLSSAKNPQFYDSIGGTLKDGVNVIWSSADDVTENGILFTVDFKVNTSAVGNYDFTISFDQDDTFDSSFNDVVFVCSSCSVTIDNSSYFLSQRYNIANIDCANGDEITVPVQVKNNVGSEATMFTISYDKDIFIPLNVIGDKSEVVGSNINTANGNLQIIVGGISAESGDGNIFTVNFKVSEKAFGQYSVTLSNATGALCEGATISVDNDDKNNPAFISFDNFIVEEGLDEVTVPVMISNNYGIMGYKLNLKYDVNIVRPTEINVGEKFSAGGFDSNIKPSTGEIIVVWNCAEDVAEDGELFYITFDVLSDATSKTSFVGSYSVNDTFNSDWNDVDIEFKNMNIYFQSEEILTAVSGTDTVINKDVIYGLPVGGVEIADYISVKAGYDMVVEGCKAYTGTIIKVYFEEVLVKEYYTVIFGDTNCDGWYDGTDSVMVNCIVNGMLTREQVGEAVWTAADCNHDGVIDELDVALLNEAGLLLSQVDQTKSEEELETDSVYQEYLSLIDQSTTEKETEKQTTQPEKPANEKKTFADLFKLIFETIFNYFKSLFKITK